MLTGVETRATTETVSTVSGPASIGATRPFLTAQSRLRGLFLTPGIFLGNSPSF